MAQDLPHLAQPIDLRSHGRVPYRKSQQSKPKKRAKSAPVLDELVKQFSDRYAFLRELVQNAIDAGATRVRAGVTRDGDDRTTFIEDDGSGMTLDIIKGPFLTKFSSSKEGDDSKIGRYGVGFLSVFALSPRLVVVETETADAAYTIEIEPTFAYRVSKRPPLGKKGTRIAIIEAVTDSTSKDADHIGLVEHALSRWCRFAKITIELEVGSETRTINCELSLVAPVVAEFEQDGMRVLVGPTRGTQLMPGMGKGSSHGDFAGFYSRGLTLVEATSGSHIIEGVRYCVDCSKLAHTISRDDVVHNTAYERAKRVVLSLAAEKLPELVGQALHAAASESARSGTIVAAFPALLRAGRGLLPEDALVVPTVSGPLCAVQGLSARAKAPSSITAELEHRRMRVALDPTGKAGWLPETLKWADQLLTEVTGRLATNNDTFARTLLSTLWGMGLQLERVFLADGADVDGHASRIVYGDDLRKREDGSLRLFLPRSSEHGLPVLVLFMKEPALAALARLPPDRRALLAARLVWLEHRGELPRRVNLDLLDASLATWSGT